MDGGARMGRIEHFLSTFTDTGGNLGMSPRAIQEMHDVRDALSPFQRASAPLVRANDYAKKILDGYYWQKAYDYAIFDPDSASPGGVSMQRRSRHVARPTFYWKGHMLGH